MSKKKSYDEVSVLRILSKKNAISFKGKEIHVSKDSGDVGNGSWGKIDYLVKIHGYVHINSTGNVSRPVRELGKSKDKSKTKTVTKFRDKDKVNMASLTKTAMKKVASK